jgi:4-alpha-glucanotransferase
MRRHRFHTSYVIQFEANTAPGSSGGSEAGGGTRGLNPPPAGSSASLGTHDLPTFAAFWRGDDVRLLAEVGLLGPIEAARRRDERDDIRAAIVEGLGSRGLLTAARPGARDVLEAALRFLGQSEAALAVVALEDLWLEERPQNVPGTAAERPNWRGRLRLTLDELETDARVRAPIDAVARERAAAAGRTEAA